MLRRLSPRAELVLLNLICFGPFAAMSVIGLTRRETLIVYTDEKIYMIVGIELVAGALAALLLRARGWTFADLGLRISMPLTIGGMLLLIGANVTIFGIYEVFRALTGSDPGAATTLVARASWPAVILFLLIDPIYEETFEVAYNLRATASDGAAFGITLSATVRLICHAYQGPIAALTILPLGIVFAVVYWKWRRVWPLAVAHGVMGYFAFAPHE